MKKFINALNKTEEVVLVAMFALMVAIIFIQVVMRKLNNSLYWSEELGKFLFIWISWLGISIGEKRGEHIKITMLTDKFSPKVQHITTPEPLPSSTFSSSRTGTVKSKSGTLMRLPSRCLFFSSSGWINMH